MGSNCRQTPIFRPLREFRKWDTHLANLFARLHQSLPCVKGGGTRKRDGGIVKVRFSFSTIPQPPTASAQLTHAYGAFTQGSLTIVSVILIKKRSTKVIVDRFWHPQQESNL